MFLVFGMILVLTIGFLTYKVYRRWLIRMRLQRLREIADQVVAETEARERQRMEAQALALPEPEPEISPEAVRILLVVLADYGATVVEFLGQHGPEVLHLRDVSGGIRLRIASVWARLNPRPPPSLHSEADEETDSGLASSSGDTPPSLSREWEAVHA